MPSTPSLSRPASRMALRTASTAIARVLRADWRLYSVSPTPTMQYLSLSDAMGSSAPRLYARAAGGVKRGMARAPELARIVAALLRGPLRVQDRGEGTGGVGALDADDAVEPRDRVPDAPGRLAAGAGPGAFLAL